MAQSQVSFEGSPNSLYSLLLPVMVAGKCNVALPASFNPGCSQIVGFKRETVGGTVGYPKVLSIAVPAGGDYTADAPHIYVKSLSATDTSVYRVFWYNAVAGAKVNLDNSILPL